MGRDRRRARRIRTLSRVIRIGDGIHEGFGQCRDLSDVGMRLALSIPVTPGQFLEVAFSPDWSFRARVVWVKGNECGIAFQEPVNAMAVLSNTASQSYAGDSCRDEAGPGRPTTAGREAPAGAVRFKSGLHVKLKLENGAEQSAVIRWTKNRAAALVLLDPYRVNDG